jgi:seryl-tRNA synthetase
MLDIKFIRENFELVKQNCKNRNSKVNIDKLLDLDIERRELLTKTESLRAERKNSSKTKPGEEEIQKMRAVGEQIKALEQKLELVDAEYKNLLLQIPNLTHPETPIGGEGEYKVIFAQKNTPKFKFKPADHEELMLKNDLVDFERGTKVTGQKFYFFKNNIVEMNHAMLKYGMDVAKKYGYSLIETPDIAKNEILKGVGFNPRGEETQVYSIENTDISLIGTAEITIGGFHSNEVLDLSKGAKKYAALSHCYRTEAGAYGRASKGLYRVHQFTKLELFVFCKPEDSEKYHEEILQIEMRILDGLKLNYRVINIASGDLGGPAYKKYDCEAWMTMNNGYGEITSCSNCTDYQSRRLNIKYKKESGETALVHTLNGTAITTSRLPIAIAEQCQTKDGRIKVPKILKKYCGLKFL